jgi:PAT family beta-lactamase induction signal transducer AmpG
MSLYLSENRPLRLGTLCILYAAQGIPDGFVRIALKTYLIGLGVTTDAVGNVIAMVSWPWAMKWVWGPFIDRFGYAPMGRRRPWILAAQILMAVTLLAMLQIPNLAAELKYLALMVLLVNIFASLQDVSVDALAVDLLPAKERGVANGFMYGSNYAGS